MTSSAFLLIVGAVILLGVAGNKFFHVTRIPSSLLLMIAGMILGPMSGFLSIPYVAELAKLTGALALVLIMFEGGLELEISKLRGVLGPAMFLGLGTFLLSAGLVFGATRWIFDFTPLQSFVTALIIGGASPAVVIPLLIDLKLRKDLAALFTLECTISELCTVVGVLLTLDVYAQGKSLHGMLLTGSLLKQVGIALAVAFITGVLWGRLANWLRGESLSYMLTLAFLCILYAVVHALGGEASLAVLFFGLVLSNASEIVHHAPALLRKVGVRKEFQFNSARFVIDEFLVHINAELSFLIRIVFFLLMGLMFDLRSWTLTHFSLAMVLVVAAVFARYVVSGVASGIGVLRDAEPGMMAALFPRGLATGSMALFAVEAGIFASTPDQPIAQWVLQGTFGTILFSNIGMAIALQFARRRPVAKPAIAG